VELVGGGQDLRLVDHVDPDRLQDLSLREVADPDLGHDGYRYRVDDLHDDLGVGHPGHPAHLPYIGRHRLEGHHRHRPRILCDDGLLRGGDVHDDAPLLHLSKAAFEQLRAETKFFQLHDSQMPRSFLSRVQVRAE